MKDQDFEDFKNNYNLIYIVGILLLLYYGIPYVIYY